MAYCQQLGYTTVPLTISISAAESMQLQWEIERLMSTWFERVIWILFWLVHQQNCRVLIIRDAWAGKNPVLCFRFQADLSRMAARFLIPINGTDLIWKMLRYIEEIPWYHLVTVQSRIAPFLDYLNKLRCWITMLLLSVIARLLMNESFSRKHFRFHPRRIHSKAR